MNYAPNPRPDPPRDRLPGRRLGRNDREGFADRRARSRGRAGAVPRRRGALPADPRVAFFHALKAADLADLALRHKRALWEQLTTLKPGPLQAVEFAPGATLDFERLAAGALGYAERYREARDRHIAPGPDGGAPAVAGTGLTVHAVLARLEAGAALEDFTAEYPGVPPRAFAAAQIYAATHPPRGRPRRVS